MAVLRAVERDVAEITVNPGPKRLMEVANAISPGAVTWILRRFGVYEFYRQQAEDNAR